VLALGFLAHSEASRDEMDFVHRVASEFVARQIAIALENSLSYRELQNIIERSVILSRDRTLELAMPEMAVNPPNSIAHSKTSSNDERERILRVLKDTNGVVSGPKGAACRLGLKRTTLQARMKKLGINRDYQ
jgi:transcriptional regulator with GAF, ATPase, and Fis domain